MAVTIRSVNDPPVAGSDAFSITVTDPIAQRQKLATRTREYVARRVQIDYATYARYRKKLLML